jgi:hypothetical protein
VILERTAAVDAFLSTPSGRIMTLWSNTGSFSTTIRRRTSTSRIAWPWAESIGESSGPYMTLVVTRASRLMGCAWSRSRRSDLDATARGRLRRNMDHDLAAIRRQLDT